MHLKTLFIFIFTTLTICTDIPIKINYSAYYKEFPYLNSLIWVESRNKDNAVSHKGAVGKMQITKPVVDDHNTFCTCGEKYNLNDMFNTKENFHVGLWQLKRLKKYYQCEVKTVSAYNTGIGNTDSGMINFQYVFAILGTNYVMNWLGDKKVKPWKGTSSCYYVFY